MEKNTSEIKRLFLSFDGNSRWMSSSHAEKENLFYDSFNELYQDFKKDPGNIPLLIYAGELSQSLTYALSGELEKVLIAEHEKKTLIKRIFSIFIEALQNIRLHGLGSDQDRRYCGIAIYKTEKAYRIFASNLSHGPKKTGVLDRIAEVNALDAVELKKLYMERMMTGNLSEKGGAGLGIITIAMKSSNPIISEITDLGDDYFALHIAFSVDRETA